MTTGLDRRGKAERHLLEWIMEMGARNSLRAQKGAKNCAKVWATPETWPACSDGFSYTSVCFLVCPFSWDVLRNWSQGGKVESSINEPYSLSFTLRSQYRCYPGLTSHEIKAVACSILFQKSRCVKNLTFLYFFKSN